MVEVTVSSALLPQQSQLWLGDERAAFTVDLCKHYKRGS